MDSDLIIFSLQGTDITAGGMLRSIRLPRTSPAIDNWLAPDRVLAAVGDGPWYDLVYLCGVNPERCDRPCHKYPRKVRYVWMSYNPGNLESVHVSEAARRMLNAGLIGKVTLGDDGSIVDTKPAARSTRYMVTCVKHGDSCDGHAVVIGTADTREGAARIIAEDKTLFRAMLADRPLVADGIHERPDEIWDGPDELTGRVYDIHET